MYKEGKIIFKVSIVIPVFQNRETIVILCDEIINAFKSPDIPVVNLQFILVDDGSTDNSWHEMKKLVSESSGVEYLLIRFTRNFGQMSALLAGYNHSDGDCVISMAADFQDPPEVTPLLFKAWLDGGELVIASRASRNDGFITNLVSKISWGLLRRHAIPQLPTGGFDYFLMDQKLKNDFIKDPEQNIFLQGRLLFYGYRITVINYIRKKRLTGNSQSNFGKRIKYFIDGFIAHSFIPLRLVSIFGLVMFFISFIATILIFWNVLFHGVVVQGWASTMIVILLLNGIQMLSIGILGEYIWRGVEEARKRPHYIILETFKSNL